MCWREGKVQAAMRRALQYSLLSGLFAMGSVCGAAEPAMSSADGRQSAQIREWLARLHRAAQTLSFEGNFVAASGGQTASLRIARIADGRERYERIEALDGEERISYRHNDLMQTVWPASRTVWIEHRHESSVFPMLINLADGRILDFYRAVPLATDRVAGHVAEVFRLDPRDGYRYGWRLWVEKHAGLLLRAEVISANGRVLAWSRFSQVDIDTRLAPESMRLSQTQTDGFRVVRSQALPADLAQEAWQLTELPPGFRLVRALRRELSPDSGSSLVGATTPQKPTVLQAIYSDGVAVVSVFVEPFEARRAARQERSLAFGATHTLSRRLGDWWITVVGDVPPVTLRWFVSRSRQKEQD